MTIRGGIAWASLVLAVLGCKSPAEPTLAEQRQALLLSFKNLGPLCGAENEEAVADFVCTGKDTQCEGQALCCQAAGYAATVEDCVIHREESCRLRTRAAMQAGACFLPDLYEPECKSLLESYLAECTSFSFFPREYWRKRAALKCSQAWSVGNVPEGETCFSSLECEQAPEGYQSGCAASLSSNMTQAEGNTLRCRNVLLRNVGDSCTNGCSRALVCGPDNTCQESRSNGDACEGDFDCDEKLCLEGRCVASAERACSADSDCAFGDTCIDTLCQSVGSPAMCSFGPPKPVEGACELNNIVTELVGTQARNCSFGNRWGGEAACIAAAIEADKPSFWLSERGFDTQRAIVILADGTMQFLDYDSDRFGENGGVETVYVEVCGAFQQEAWNQCQSPRSYHYLCD